MCKKLVLLISFVLLLAIVSLSGPAHAGTFTGIHQTAIINTDWAATAQDITAMSTNGDWRLWDTTVGSPAYEKDTPRDLIYDLEQIGSWRFYKSNSPGQNFAWSDGVSPQNTLGTPVSVCSSEGIPDDEGYQVNVMLPRSKGNITVWAGTRYATGILTILDGGVEVFSIEGNSNEQFWGFDRFDLAFSSFSPGTIITIKWISTSGKASARCLFYGVAIADAVPIAFNPNPADGAEDVLRDSILSWTPGEFANTHDVYIGTDFNNVNEVDTTNPLDVLIIEGYDVNSYDIGRLEFGQTYYWRVDEVNGPPDRTVFKGTTWEFTTEFFSYVIAGDRITAIASSQSEESSGPEKTIDGSGLTSVTHSIDTRNDVHSTDISDMWFSSNTDTAPWIQYNFDKPYKLDNMLVWNFNGILIWNMLGLKAVDVEYSTNGGATWQSLSDVPEFAMATGKNDYRANTIIPFDNLVVNAVKLTAINNWSGGVSSRVGLSEINFLTIPTYATSPDPPNGATNIPVNVILSWKAGREASMHKVYLSTDQVSVLSGTATATTVSQARYILNGVDLGTTYYWRVDEVNDAETTPTYYGDIWSFVTQD